VHSVSLNQIFHPNLAAFDGLGAWFGHSDPGTCPSSVIGIVRPCGRIVGIHFVSGSPFKTTLPTLGFPPSESGSVTPPARNALTSAAVFASLALVGTTLISTVSSPCVVADGAVPSTATWFAFTPICDAIVDRNSSFFAANAAGERFTSRVNTSGITQSHTVPAGIFPAGHAAHANVDIATAATLCATFGVGATSLSATYATYSTPGDMSPLKLCARATPRPPTVAFTLPEYASVAPGGVAPFTTAAALSGGSPGFHTKRRRGGVERRQMELKGVEGGD
jgi:hypothetical protein